MLISSSACRIPQIMSPMSPRTPSTREVTPASSPGGSVEEGRTAEWRLEEEIPPGEHGGAQGGPGAAMGETLQPSVCLSTACHILECCEGLAQSVISTVGQAFELRFKQYLHSPPKVVVPPER